jgi:pectate lyase
MEGFLRKSLLVVVAPFTLYLGACVGSIALDPGLDGAGGSTPAASGGRAGVGGTPGLGGATGTGGSTRGGGGGSIQTGGASGSGGRAATGGATGQGGGAGTGVKGTGGAAATGGVSGTGGAITQATAGPPETKPTGYGKAATGGGSASAQVVSSMAEMQAAVDAYAGTGGLVLSYTGKFDFGSITDPCAQWGKAGQIVEIKQKNDITITGTDGSAANFGLHVASSSSNIIVRNMTFGLLPGGDAADAISVEGLSSGVPTDIWIDHNELFSSMAVCPGAGDSSFDGLIDFKKGADRVTVSYNYLHDHHKVSLNGFTDTDDAVRHITFHHNVFDNIGSRTPLQRHGFSHMLNNYFGRITTTGINIRMGGYSLVEANFFQTVKDAVTSRDSTALGFWELRNNNVKTPADFATYGLTWSPSSSVPSKDATDWTTTAAYPEALGYPYTADPAECLAVNLLKFAGAGKKLATLSCR